MTWRTGQAVVHVDGDEEIARGVVDDVLSDRSARAFGGRWKCWGGGSWGNKQRGQLRDAGEWDREALRRQQRAMERAEREARFAAELERKRLARVQADRVHGLDVEALVELAAWLDAREVSDE